MILGGATSRGTTPTPVVAAPVYQSTRSSCRTKGTGTRFAIVPTPSAIPQPHTQVRAGRAARASSLSIQVRRSSASCTFGRAASTAALVAQSARARLGSIAAASNVATAATWARLGRKRRWPSVSVRQARAVAAVAVDVEEHGVGQREWVGREGLAIADDGRERILAVDAHDDVAVALGREIECLVEAHGVGAGRDGPALRLKAVQVQRHALDGDPGRTLHGDLGVDLAAARGHEVA